MNKTGFTIDLSQNRAAKIAVMLLSFAALFGTGYVVGMLLARIF